MTTLNELEDFLDFEEDRRKIFTLRFDEKRRDEIKQLLEKFGYAVYEITPENFFQRDENRVSLHEILEYSQSYGNGSPLLPGFPKPPIAIIISENSFNHLFVGEDSRKKTARMTWDTGQIYSNRARIA